MKKKFYATPDLGFTAVMIFGVCGLGYLLLSWSAGTLGGLWSFFVLYFLSLSVFWVAANKGTFVTIDDKEICGRVLYLFGGKTSISSIVSLKKVGSFGGAITQIYMMCRREDGSIEERGLTSKEMLKKEDLKELIEIIRIANPSISIPSDLLSK
jgi:hypothetical protein